MTFRNRHLAIPLAGALILGAAGSALAQSANAKEHAAANSAVAQGTSKGTAATQKGEHRTDKAVNTGMTAVARHPTGTAALGSAADVVATTPAASAAPVALALADSGGAPAANPEPLSVILVGGALAGLYRMRKHLT